MTPGETTNKRDGLALPVAHELRTDLLVSELMTEAAILVSLLAGEDVGALEAAHVALAFHVQKDPRLATAGVLRHVNDALVAADTARAELLLAIKAAADALRTDGSATEVLS